MFGCFLGPKSLVSFEWPLAHIHASLPIIFDGIRFIPTSTITLWTYLRSWDLVAWIIVIRFMVDQSLPSYSFNASWHQHLPFPTIVQDGIAPNTSVSFSFWTIYRTTNGSISKFHLRASTPSCIFQYVFWWDVRGPLCLNLIMFWPSVNIWHIVQLVFLAFRLSSLIFSFQMWLRLPHLSIVSAIDVCAHIPSTLYVCTCCTCDNECTWTHDIICNTFFTVMQDANFHVGWKQLHAFPSTTFSSSYQRIDNVFTKDGIHTLTNVVITNPTHVDLLPRSRITQRFATLDMI